MRSFRGIHTSSRRQITVAALGFLLLVANQTPAQSGRRAPRPQTSSTATPTTNENSEVVVSKVGARELTRRVTIVVAREPTSKHLLSEDTSQASFMRRLNEFKNVTGTGAGDMKRSGAVKRARTETELIVVLLQFDIDSFQNGTIILNSPDLDVRVLAFAPRTGKEQFKGKVYYKAVGGPMMKK